MINNTPSPSRSNANESSSVFFDDEFSKDDEDDDDNSSKDSYHDAQSPTAAKIEVEPASPGMAKIKTHRQRSQSDPVCETTDDKSVTVGSENEEGYVPDMATVQIQKDPRRIYLSSTVYDQKFIDYLWLVEK